MLRVLFVGFALISLSACAASPPVPDARPADFAVEYGWGTGSLPPRYHNSVHITLDADGTGTFVGRTAYGQGPSETWTYSLSDADRTALYQGLAEGGAFGSWPQDDNPPSGGSGWWLEARADGMMADIPTFVRDRRSADKDALADAARAIAPSEIWSMHGAWLRQAQATLSDAGD